MRYFCAFFWVLFACAVLSLARSPADAMHLTAGAYDVPQSELLPTASLSVSGGVNIGWMLKIRTTGFAFSPESINQLHRPGEGSASLFIDGKRVTKIFGPYFELPDLSPGPHRLFVGFVTNNGMDMVTEGRPVGSALQIMIPDPNPWKHHSEPVRIDWEAIAMRPQSTVGIGISIGLLFGLMAILSWRKSGVLIVALAVTIPIAGLSLSVSASRTGQNLKPIDGLGGPLALEDARNGEAVTLEQFRGKAVLVHFTSASCGEPCAVLLNRAAQVLYELRELRANLAILNVGMDSDAGFVSHFADSVRTFSADIQPLTGSDAAMASVARNFRVIEQTTGPTRGAASNSQTFLLDDEGRPVLRVADDMPHDALAKLIRGLIAKKRP